MNMTDPDQALYRPITRISRKLSGFGFDRGGRGTLLLGNGGDGDAAGRVLPA